MSFIKLLSRRKHAFVRKVLLSQTAETMLGEARSQQVARRNEERLQKVLETCKEFDTRMLIAVSVAYGQMIQNERITWTLESTQHEKHPGSRLTDIHEALFEAYDKIQPEGQENFFSLFHDELIERPIRIPLNRHGVIVAPWNLEWLKNAIPHYGGVMPWQQQADHQAVVYWPIPLIILYAGNHSFAAGVLNKQGFIENKMLVRIHNISKLYDVLECDGQGLRRKDDKSRVGRRNGHQNVWDIRWGILFELGRLIAAKQGWEEEMVAWCAEGMPRRADVQPIRV